MIEGLLVVLFGAAAVCLLVLGLIALPFLLLGFLFKLVFFVVTLPFRILGALLGALVGVGLFALKGFLFLIAAVGGVLLLGGAVLLIPFLPVLLLVGAVLLVARLVRPRPAYGAAR